MKFNDFVKKYPNYSTYRFSQDEHGEVTFLFNGHEYHPFNKDGSLVKTLYHFPGDGWKPENINDFLGNLQYRYNAKTDYHPISSYETPQKLNYYDFEIYITPKEKLKFTFTNIFSHSKIYFKSAKEAQAWLQAPTLSYWSQALNFAVWCATTGCGVTRDFLQDTQVGSFYKFHVYFTIRRILK